MDSKVVVLAKHSGGAVYYKKNSSSDVFKHRGATAYRRYRQRLKKKKEAITAVKGVLL